MQEKTFILTKNYLQVKAFYPFEVYCREGRTFKFSIMEDSDKFGEYFLMERKDFLYSHSDTSITMCHLTFKGENLDGLEFTELDYFNLVSKNEYYEHKKENLEFEERNDQEHEEMKETTSVLRSDFESYKTTHAEEFEAHKKENLEFEERNDNEHKEFIKLDKIYKSVTWQELKDLRDTSSLTKGCFYRIIDYNCYLVSDQKMIQSGLHQFDVIVIATEENKLSENAFALAHEGDTYFQYCNLEAWELKYSLDNNQKLYPWCASDGKGVIWWMKDEYGNEAYYDFKNVKMVRFEITADTNNTFGNFSSSRLFTYNVLSSQVSIDITNLYYFYTFSLFLSKDNEIKDLTTQNLTELIQPLSSSYKDAISFGNNKMLDRSFIGSKLDTFLLNCFIASDRNPLSSNDDYVYGKLVLHNNIFTDGANTFNFLSGASEDYSNIGQTTIKGESGSAIRTEDGEALTFDSENTTEEYIAFTNGMIFKGQYMQEEKRVWLYSESLEIECYIDDYNHLSQVEDFGTATISLYKKIKRVNFSSCYKNSVDGNYNTFGSECFCNVFSKESNDNLLGNNCSYNSFKLSYENVLRYNCKYNTFINSYGNILDNNCNNNTFEKGCYENTLSSSCDNNSFGAVCYKNTLSGACDNNSFGINCYSNTITSGNNNSFGNECYSNSILSNSSYNSFGDKCYSNSVGSVTGECNYNKFSSNCYFNSLGDNNNYNTFKLACHNNTLGTNNIFNYFGRASYSNKFENECSNNTFGTSCHSNTLGKYNTYFKFDSYCESNTFGEHCKNITFGSNCSCNTLGTYCYYITFHSNCVYNTFGSSHASGLISYCRNIIFFPGIWCLNLYTSIAVSDVSDRTLNQDESKTFFQNVIVHSSTGSYGRNLLGVMTYNYATYNLAFRGNKYALRVYINSNGSLVSSAGF